MTITRQYLPQVLPELLICTKLSEADKRNIIKTKEDDLFHDLGDGKQRREEEAEVDEEDEYCDDDDYTIDSRGRPGNRTLRKSAAYSLAQFSKTFQEETFKVLQPCLEKAIAKQIVVPGQSVYHTEDPALDMKEAGILVLGTICDPDACLKMYEGHMTKIVPFLLEELNGTSPLIKATTLWTLQKFSSWTARETDAASFGTYMQAIVL